MILIIVILISKLRTEFCDVSSPGYFFQHDLWKNSEQQTQFLTTDAEIDHEMIHDFASPFYIICDNRIK